VWPPFQGWLYIVSDLGIWSAYFAIPLILLKFIREKKELPFLRIFWLFAAFIFACGTTHFMDALMFWWPAYRLSSLIYLWTAVVSWVTVFALIPIIPQVLSLKTSTQLEAEIRERYKAELALQQSEMRFKTLVEHVTDYAIFYLTPEGNVASWNKGAERLNGYIANEIIGKHFSIFYPPDKVEQKYPRYELEVAGKVGRYEDEGWRVRKDGSRYWASVIITAMRNEQEEIIGFSKVVRDLTERKNAEDSLKGMNEELERQVEARTNSIQRLLKREMLAVTIINSIRSETNLNTILEKTVNLLGQSTLADRCAFWGYNAKTKQYNMPESEYHSSDSPDIRYVRDTVNPMAPILPPTCLDDELINISDITQIKNFSDEDQLAIQQRGIKSMLSVPVLFRGRILGRLQIQSIFENREWDSETVKMVQYVADQVAVAIQHAKIFQYLQVSEARKSAIMDSALDAVIIMDHEGLVVEWNTGAEKIFGYKRQEVTGQPMHQLIIPERFRMDHVQGLHHYLETGEGPLLNKLVEMPAVRSDGSEFVAEISITRVKMDGPPLFAGVLRDVTERKQSEQALIESENRFRQMADSSPIMIWLMRPDRQITYRNRTAEEFTGILNDEGGLGFGWENMIYPDDMSILVDTVDLAVRTKQKFTAECRVRRSDGSYRWVTSTGVPRFDSQNTLTGFVGTSVDIQEHKETTEALESRVQERTAQLQAANKELEAFSYSVSHDLRAPLRTIDGFSQAILELYKGKLDERGQDYLRRIRQGSQQMAKLIDDMLQLSRLTRGALNIEEDVNLSEMVTEISEELMRVEPDRCAVFKIEPDLSVRGDKRLLQAGMQNLLDNAWKYSSKHESAYIEFGHIQTQSATVYYVRDDGAGFDMRYADKLFGAFQRLHGAEEFPGTGIGLATLARIIHRHGGEVWADAEVEKGATFYFTLQPINIQEKEDAKLRQQSHSAC